MSMYHLVSVYPLGIWHGLLEAKFQWFTGSKAMALEPCLCWVSLERHY